MINSDFYYRRENKVSFIQVIPLIVGYGLGNLLVKHNKSWGEVLEIWINEIIVIVTCYLCWFVL